MSQEELLAASSDLDANELSEGRGLGFITGVMYPHPRTEILRKTGVHTLRQGILVVRRKH